MWWILDVYWWYFFCCFGFVVCILVVYVVVLGMILGCGGDGELFGGVVVVC